MYSFCRAAVLWCGLLVMMMCALLPCVRMTAEQADQTYHHVKNTAERMVSIISHLLDMNAIERGGISVHLEAVDVAPLLDAVVRDNAAAALAKDIDVSVEAASVLVRADKHLLREVMDNLVSNALKYSPRGTRVCARTRSASHLRKADLLADTPHVYIEVQDEGPGLSDDDKSKLFGKFARLSAKPTGGEHSTGLGLSIVKKLVEAMNGRVWCESTLGEGAMFIVALPLAAAETTADANADANADAPRHSTHLHTPHLHTSHLHTPQQREES
jgi:signal transduction histidine kinase